MPGPVDGPQNPDQAPENSGEYWDQPDYGFDKNYGSDPTKQGKGSTGYSSPYAKYYGTQPGQNPMGGGVSGAGDFGDPGFSDAMANKAQQLKAQGYSPQQIQTMLQQEFGVPLSDSDIDYFLYGHKNTNPHMTNKYMGYGSGPQQTTAKYSSWGNNYLEQYFQQQQMYNDAMDQNRNMKKSGKEQMVKMHMILMLIMMGDITGALRAYTALVDRDLRQFTRGVVKKLGLVRKARSRVIRNFANNKPPRAYAGENPQSAARAQDQAQRYTQFVQLSTQLMGELQNTERELVDVLQTLKRDLDNLFQAYSSMRDNEFRTAERVMTIR